MSSTNNLIAIVIVLLISNVSHEHVSRLIYVIYLICSLNIISVAAFSKTFNVLRTSLRKKVGNTSHGTQYCITSFEACIWNFSAFIVSVSICMEWNFKIRCRSMYRYQSNVDEVPTVSFFCKFICLCMKTMKKNSLFTKWNNVLDFCYKVFY